MLSTAKIRLVDLEGYVFSRVSKVTLNFGKEDTSMLGEMVFTGTCAGRTERWER